MKHKWYNEIVDWASGAEIEARTKIDNLTFTDWMPRPNPQWETGSNVEYRIKPQPSKDLCCKSCGQFLHEKQIEPKEPQYLYVYADLQWDLYSYKLCRKKGSFGQYIGKIKLEDE